MKNCDFWLDSLHQVSVICDNKNNSFQLESITNYKNLLRQCSIEPRNSLNGRSTGEVLIKEILQLICKEDTKVGGFLKINESVLLFLFFF